MVSLSQVPVNLPAPPDGLFYFEDQYDGGNVATTTGAFAKDSPNRKLENLRWLGVMVADFDLVDWLIHVENWSTDVKASKERLYTVDAATLAGMKSRHLDDVMNVVDSIVDRMKGQGACGPTYVVDSGYGCHLYFWLANPATTPEQIKAVRAENAQLINDINKTADYKLADVVHDAGTRIMRKVGTVNTRGPLGMVCGVSGEYSDPSSLWSMEPDTAPAAPRSQSVNDYQLSQARSWLCRDRSIRDWFTEAETNQDSTTDMSLACALVRRNVSPAMISRFLFSVRRRDPKHDGTGYYDRTANGAWTFVRGYDHSDSTNDYNVMHEDVLLHLYSSVSTMRAAGAVVEYDPRIRNMLWVDSRSKRIMWGDDDELIRKFCAAAKADFPRTSTGSSLRAFTDENAMQLCNWIEDVYGIHCSAIWREAVSFFAAALTKRNPVEDYLLRCIEKLDPAAEDLTETWLIRAFKIEDSPLTRLYSKKWLVGGAARAMDPGVLIKGMLVLSGAQSVGKTSALRIIGGEHYASPSTHDLLSKDTSQVCSSAWLLELEEMDFMKKNTSEAVKKFLTIQDDLFRLPYARAVEKFARPCFFAGTSNRVDLLTDATGSDRFWCVNLENASKCDFDWLRSVRDTLWGQAAKAWLDSSEMELNDRLMTINLTQDELDAQREQNVEFESSDPNADNIETAIFEVCRDRKEFVKDFCYITLEEMFDKIINRGMSTATALSMNIQLRDFNTDFRPAQQASFKNTLTRLGFAPKQVRLGDARIRAYALTPAMSKTWMDQWAEESAEVVEIDNSNVTDIRSKWNESTKTANTK